MWKAAAIEGTFDVKSGGNRRESSTGGLLDVTIEGTLDVTIEGTQFSEM